MTRRLAALLLVSALSPAAAQPQISGGDMAGRERERFIESPVERFMKPGPYTSPDVVRPGPPRKHGGKRLHRRKRH